jgi:predicted ATPase/class 3 adenylate cyclase
MEIADWLARLGLPQYAKAFAENAIDTVVLQQLTAEDLKELGVELLGHRRKLLTAIESLRSGVGPASSASAGEQSASAVAAGVISPERRHLTVLFCELVGSAALAARLDPEDLREVIQRYHSVVTDAVGAQDGFVAQYLGNGALVYFGFPIAHEDDAERAVRAALMLREGAQAIEVDGMHLQVRAGLATGLVVAGDRAEGSKASHEQQIMGETPNRAARLQALAEAGEIVIDAVTRKLVGRMFHLVEREAANLKGFADPVKCWNVRGASAIESRFEALRSGETPIVGRDEELELLAKRWQLAKAGNGRLVMICGEAGLGKSRLVSAFEQRIRSEGQIELRYFCSSQHTSTALYPVTTHLTRTAGFAEGDSPHEKLEKLRTLVARPDDLPFVADLLSLPVDPNSGVDDLAPQEKRQKVFAALLRRIEALANKTPLFILMEDLHWVDPTTQEIVDLFVSMIERVPVMMVLTYRPEFQPPWAGQANVTTIALNRLSLEDCAVLVRMHTAHGQLPANMVDEIVQRTDGVPLFAEELSKAVMDSSDVAPSKGEHGQLHVPATLHASLMARLDHLGSDARETAQACSVIGREFSYSMLRRIIREGSISHVQKIETALSALVGSGLVFARGSPPHAIYTFKHALVQDTAYATLLRAQRQRLHAALASIMTADETVAPEVLAYHFAGAGEHERAAEYWFKAGQAANERNASEEAIRTFKNALEIVASLPQTSERKAKILEITTALCNPLFITKWLMPETTEMVIRAGRLAEELGARPPAIILYHQWLLHFGSANHKEALRAAKLFVEEGGPELQTRAYTCLGNSLYLTGGSLDDALEYSSKALAAYDRKRHAKHRFQYTYEPRSNALATKSLQLALRGYFEQAKAAEQDALEYAIEIGHPQTIGLSLAYKLLREEFQRDYSEREASANAVLRHATEHNVVYWSLWTNIFRGLQRALEGRTADGIEMMDKSMKVFADMNFTYFRPLHLGMRARAYEAAGDFENALASVSEGIAFAKQSGEKVMLSDLIRLSGELRLALSGAQATETAESLFIEAIALAQAQVSKLHEIRAATSLARLLRRQEKHAEARDVLALVYSWFKEGLHSPDLIEARAVLDALSGDLQRAYA